MNSKLALVSFRVAVCAAALLTVVSCSKGKTSSPGTTATTAASSDLAPDTVVATYGDQKITAKELDEQLQSQYQEMEKKKHELRKQTLDRIITQKLVNDAAKKKGVTEQEFLKTEIEDKVAPPSEAEINAVFQQNAAQLPPGSKVEDFKARIVDYLAGPKRQEKAKEVFDVLKKEANVKVMLPEPAKARVAVEAKGPSRGPEDAKVTIVEFSDFQCPFCSRAHDTVEQVMAQYAGKVRLVFRHFPLEFHEQAPKAAEASLCAHDQQKFWPYHDHLFKNQQKLQVPDLKEHAKAVGLDTAKFNECLDSGKHASTVKADMEAGKKVGVQGTPAFFINGVMLSGAVPLESFKELIEPELATN